MLRLTLRCTAATFARRHISLSCSANGPTMIKMPALSPTMNEGTIITWFKKEGEAMAAGDALCDVETDKATVTMEADSDGILAKIVKAAGSKEVLVNEMIAVMVESDEDWKSVEIPPEWFQKPASSAPSAGAAPAASESKPAEKSTPPTANASPGVAGQEDNYGPAVRLLLHHYHLKATEVSASGGKGRLLKEDVLRHISQKGLTGQASHDSGPSHSPTKAPAVSAFVDIPLTGMRKTIAKRLTESKSSVPHQYNSVSFRVSNVMQAREVLRIVHGIKLSVNDYVIKACALALKRVPSINSTYAGEEEGARIGSEVDISIAVATPAGLITPIVRQADTLSLLEINSTVRQLAEKARANKLKPNEFQGGTFTISNLGMYGVREFTAIINPPQACILAVGGSQKQAVADPQRAGRINADETVTVTLSSDARIIDPNQAAQFLSVLRELLENPDRYLHHNLPPTSASDWDPLVGDTVGLNLLRE